MAIQSISIAPPNSVIFVEDRYGGVVPQIVSGKNVWATSTCIAVTCFSEQDGPTEIILGLDGELNSGVAPSFEGEIEVPSKILAIHPSFGHPILQMPVATERVRVKVWLSHPRWPEKVMIGID